MQKPRAPRSPVVAVNARRLAVAASLVSVAAVAVACSPSPPPPAVPTTAPDAGAAMEEDAGLASEDAAAPSGPTFFTGEADAGTGAAPGVPAGAEQATDVAIDLAIATAAPKVAPKMEQEGQVSRATLKEGESFSMMLNLMPNRCYTIVGFSPPGGVTKLDMKLFGPPLFNIEAGKSAAADKNMPVIGKGTAALCPILPVAVPYKLDAVATKGAGRIGIEVFARNK